MFTDDALIIKSVLAAIEPKLEEMKSTITSSLEDMDKNIDSLAGTIEDMAAEVEDAEAEKPVGVVTQEERFWEGLEMRNGLWTQRARVPGGWLVMIQTDQRHVADRPLPIPTFIPDPYHTWELIG